MAGSATEAKSKICDSDNEGDVGDNRGKNENDGDDG